MLKHGYHFCFINYGTLVRITLLQNEYLRCHLPLSEFNALPIDPELFKADDRIPTLSSVSWVCEIAQGLFPEAAIAICAKQNKKQHCNNLSRTSKYHFIFVLVSKVTCFLYNLSRNQRLKSKLAESVANQSLLRFQFSSVVFLSLFL